MLLGDAGLDPQASRRCLDSRRRRRVAAREAAEQFRQAARFPIRRGVEQAGKNPLRRVLEPVARQSVSCRRSDGDGFKSVFAAPGEIEFSQFWRIDIVKEFVVCAETR